MRNHTAPALSNPTETGSAVSQGRTGTPPHMR